VPDAKLIVLPDLGHMVQHATPDLVKSEIEAMIARIVPVETVSASSHGN
jgi:pimeloyl-ACP methyl ester carboxylesterase